MRCRLERREKGEKVRLRTIFTILDKPLASLVSLSLMAPDFLEIG